VSVVLGVYRLYATAAQRLSQPSEQLRLVCGSLYFIGDLLKALHLEPTF
jgi:folylpolyglutamate synthase/dihydropteroate synthase